jgi:APA family basic amino acid/polyamine antiporter
VRSLGPWGLTALGIGAVIGGGIFVITGQAAAEPRRPGHRAVLRAGGHLLHLLRAGLCRIRLAGAGLRQRLPAYATFGELAAWFIGWMLVLEYGVSGSAVAVSWTGYFLSLLDQFGLHLPAALVMRRSMAQLRPTGAVANLPAAAIVLLLTWLCYVGIRKSSAMNLAMVMLKTALIVLVIVAGWKYVDPATGTVHPRQPRPGQVRLEGVLRGAAMVFFAYIGFEAVSVAAQESKNPQRDLPIGMMLSLAICTVLYIAMARC